MDRQKALRAIDAVIAQGPFGADWDSLTGFEAPAWYQNAKFGIFIHWGPYSVPAFGNEWYPRNMYMQGSPEYDHHIRTYGPHKAFGYKDFIPLFKAERFDARAWMDLFAQAGARYVVPVAEHHDGFQMYRSDISPWNAAQKGPRRDVLGELSAAARERNIVLGASSHRIEHWFFMEGGRAFDSDVVDPMTPEDLYWPAMPQGSHFGIDSKPGPDQAFMEDWLLRCCELVDAYRPRLFYFDWWIQHVAARPYLKRFAAYYYNRAAQWGVEVAINYKYESFMFGSAVPDVERGQFADVKPYFWQTDTAVARNSWSYTENNSYKSPQEIVRDLVDIVSKNGTLLLNIGPRADGVIPEEDASILRGIGAWLGANGEAIYDTHCWRIAGEGPTRIAGGGFTDETARTFTPEDIRFTMKGSCLYATVLSYPEDGRVTIASLADTNGDHEPVFGSVVRDVRALGFDEAPQWQRTEKGLTIQTQTIQTDYPVVFRIQLD